MGVSHNRRDVALRDVGSGAWGGKLGLGLWIPKALN